MEDSPLTDKISRIKITKLTKVSFFIDNNKTWNISKLNSILPEHVVVKIASITSPVNNIQDKFIWKCTTSEIFLFKTVIEANNDLIPSNPSAKLLNSIWKLQIIPKINLFS